MESFGLTIRKIREQAKKSMKDLATVLNVSPVYVSDIELGHRAPPDNEKLDQIADFLNLDRKDVREWAIREKGFVRIDLKEGTPLSKVALALMRWGDLITEEKAKQILTILKVQ